jgi:hypothetical protein
MKSYFITFIQTLNSDVLFLSNYIPNIFIKYLSIFKHFFIESFINFENIYFFIFNIIFIFILTKIFYNIFYFNICYLGFELLPLFIIDLKQLKQYILLNKFESKFLIYYKSLLKLNIKQFLIGTGIIIFILLSCFIIFIGCDFFSFYKTNILNNSNNLYYPFYFSFLSNYYLKLEFINIFFFLILIYVFLHIIFGVYNIFYDYLKDISFILFFLSFFIFFILFNLFILFYNLDFYKIFFEFLLT